ncbi:PREDICTED: facilitated trehalose transporter Tret1-like [Drosophila arizonae]|uniref:Facilitated trehalose transporter Tret1-like n=1 Tax=Drosophila arizonae TaxID=7263 RepID=A0ABM1NUT8_DROAR|nr:PREDICTED: facilitated trehalose transporter Tret1-like [Drosophila arizonae]
MFAQLFQRSNCLLNQRNRYQLLATVLINLICISHGMGIGWLSPTLRKLQSTDSPLQFSLDVNDVSWVGSALGLGSVTGNIICGLLINRIGGKLCLLLIAVPHSCLWFLVYFAQSVEFLIVGRFLAGITGGGIYIIHPIFLSEISDANIRGTLASMVMLSVNIGILLGYILGTHLAYYSVPFVVLLCPLSYFALILLFIRDSPMQLIREQRFAAAEKSFRYYKNIKDSDSLDKQSLATLEFENIKMKLTNEDDMPDKVSLKDFLTPAAIKGYAMAGVIVIANQFSGLFTMVNYMSDIFAKSGSSMDPNTSSIIIGVVQILGAYMSTLLCDVCGRKILMQVSSAGVAMSLTAFGLFTHFASIYDLSEWSWVPVALMSLDIFLGNIGLISCIFVLIVEMFPMKIRARATSVAIVVCSSLVFLMLNIFPLCMEHWGLPATMWSCACITAVCFVCFSLFLKETKGKSMVED